MLKSDSIERRLRYLSPIVRWSIKKTCLHLVSRSPPRREPYNPIEYRRYLQPDFFQRTRAYRASQLLKRLNWSFQCTIPLHIDTSFPIAEAGIQGPLFHHFLIAASHKLEDRGKSVRKTNHIIQIKKLAPPLDKPKICFIDFLNEHGEHGDVHDILTYSIHCGRRDECHVNQE